jgi:hypothetical protein
MEKAVAVLGVVGDEADGSSGPLACPRKRYQFLS